MQKKAASEIDKLKKYDYSGISSKMWIDTGDAEGKFMSFSDEVLAELKEVKEDNSLEIVYYLAPDAVHSESAWAKRVHSPLLYFFGSIGRAEELELFSSPIVGIEGPGQLINPVITTDNNFKMTVLNGNYKSSKSDILEVSELGRLIPKKSGKAEITFSALGLKAEKEVEVVKKLSKEVEVEINLHLNDQNNFNDLFMAASKPREIKMEKIGDRDYTASITLKRGELIHFKFTLGSWEAVEKDAEGRDIDSRTIRADKKKSLYFEAERFY